MLLNYMRTKNILKSVYLIFSLIFSFILFNINAIAQVDYIKANSELSDLSQICEESIGSKESFLQKMNPKKENLKNVNTDKTKLKAQIKVSPKSLYFASSEEIRAYQDKVKLKLQQDKEQRSVLVVQNQGHQNKVDSCLQS